MSNNFLSSYYLHRSSGSAAPAHIHINHSFDLARLLVKIILCVHNVIFVTQIESKLAHQFGMLPQITKAGISTPSDTKSLRDETVIQLQSTDQDTIKINRMRLPTSSTSTSLEKKMTCNMLRDNHTIYRDDSSDRLCCR